MRIHQQISQNMCILLPPSPGLSSGPGPLMGSVSVGAEVKRGSSLPMLRPAPPALASTDGSFNTTSLRTVFFQKPFGCQ